MQVDNSLQTSVFLVALMLYGCFAVLLDRSDGAFAIIFPDRWSHVFVACFLVGDLGQDFILGLYMGTAFGERFGNMFRKPWRRFSRPALMMAVAATWLPITMIVSTQKIAEGRKSGCISSSST